MVAKKTNFDMKTILVVLLIALIGIAVAYVFLNPSEETEDVLLIEELRLNKDNYDGKTVMVTGTYHLDGDRHTLTTPTTDADPNSEEYIYLDLSDINLTEDPAIEGDKYKVRGEVEVVEEGFAFEIQIIAESFKKV